MSKGLGYSRLNKPNFPFDENSEILSKGEREEKRKEIEKNSEYCFYCFYCGYLARNKDAAEICPECGRIGTFVPIINKVV